MITYIIIFISLGCSCCPKYLFKGQEESNNVRCKLGSPYPLKSRDFNLKSNIIHRGKCKLNSQIYVLLSPLAPSFCFKFMEISLSCSCCLYLRTFYFLHKLEFAYGFCACRTLSVLKLTAIQIASNGIFHILAFRRQNLVSSLFIFLH